MANPAAFEPGPLVTLVRRRTVAVAAAADGGLEIVFKDGTSLSKAFDSSNVSPKTSTYSS